MRLFLPLLILVGTACSPKASFTPSSNRTYPPKSASCPLEMLATPPQRAYDEIGVYDMELGSYAVTSAESVRDYLQPRVCQLGGDAFIVYANGEGVYVKAVAIHWKEAAPAPATAPAEVPPASPAAEPSPQAPAAPPTNE
jgi:hypothetical protein